MGMPDRYHRLSIGPDWRQIKSIVPVARVVIERVGTAAVEVVVGQPVVNLDCGRVRVRRVPLARASGHGS